MCRSLLANILVVALSAGLSLTHARAPAQAEVRYELQKLVAPDGGVLGGSVCVSGRRIITGAPFDSNIAVQAGSAYLFRLDSNGTPDIPGDDVWVFEGKLTASDAAAYDRFGESVFIKSTRAVIGAPGDSDAGPSTGSAYVFRLDNGGTPLDQSDDFWTQEAKLTAADGDRAEYFGASVAVDEYWVIAGVDIHKHAGVQTGAAYMFRRDDNGTPSDPSDDSWAQAQELRASVAIGAHFFGGSVAIDGDWAVVGATGDHDFGLRSGAAYVFRRDDNDTPLDLSDDLWIEQSKLTALDGTSYHFFGIDVSIQCGWIVVGAFGDDDTGERSGAAYVFRHDDRGSPSYLADDLWVQEEKLTASDGAENDHLGRSVSVNEGIVVAGAWHHVRGLCADNRDLCTGDANCTVGACEQSGEGCHTIEECASGVCSDGQTACHYPGDCPDLTFCNSPPPEPCIGGATCGIRTGAAYLFQRHDNGTPGDEGDDFWAEEAMLAASEGNGRDQFGRSVSIDHGLVVVGADGLSNVGSSSGIAYLFSADRPGGPIPTVSEWGLIVMTLLVLTAGTLVYQRRGHTITQAPR